MPIVFRKAFKLGPFRFNVNKSGWTSTTIKVGPWSWNTKTRAHRVDLPGPFSWRGKRR